MGIWCRHRNQTVPHKDEQGEYCRCLECGRRISWSWGHDSSNIRPPRLLQPEAIEKDRFHRDSSLIREIAQTTTRPQRFVKPPTNIASKKSKILRFLREA